jgi:ribosomal protein L7/L12
MQKEKAMAELTREDVKNFIKNMTVLELSEFVKELEEEFGMPRLQIAKVIRELMDANKVEKHDLLYFAT